MLGTNTSTSGSVSSSSARQSTRPASPSGSGRHMSNEIVGPASRACASIRRNSLPPSAYIARMIGGYPKWKTRADVSSS